MQQWVIPENCSDNVVISLEEILDFLEKFRDIK